MSSVVRINEKIFKRRITRSNKPALCLFYMNGICACLPIDLIVEQLAQQYQGLIRFFSYQASFPQHKVDPIILEHRIQGFPTIITFYQGKVIDHYYGEGDMSFYENMCAQLLEQTDHSQTNNPE